MARALTFLEFFAGGGMARAGLGRGWRCLFANDFDPMKRAAYAANFGDAHLSGADVHDLSPRDLPAMRADLAWASSPCQDVSLAGLRGGLAASRSGAFFGFWRLIETLAREDGAPRAIVLENVRGLVTSNRGADFRAVVTRFSDAGYIASAVVLDAADFAPQSRPRLFLLALPKIADAALFAPTPNPSTAPTQLVETAAQLPRDVDFRWLAAAPQRVRNASLADIIDAAAPFDDDAKTRRRLSQMAPLQLARIEALRNSPARSVGAAFRRMREECGGRTPRIEARFDGLSGCLRTPSGGSSRQFIFVAGGGRIDSRLMTPREAARAMGLPDDYRLPARTQDALKLIGDGVCPQAVGWLARHVIEKALARQARRAA
jgi:DNA (cytosine-5)-methyltransferase 1